jgi:type IV pilus assembly protein PilA
MRRPCTGAGRRSAFTLVELLVVILILAVLMAVAVPLYLAAVDDSQLKTCRANMQTIVAAAQAYRVNHPTYGAIGGLTGAEISGRYTELGVTPLCPGGGVYTVTEFAADTPVGNKTVPAGGIIVECTLHGSLVPGLDHE